MTDTPRPTSATPASQWRKETSELVKLPSGNDARLTRPPLARMIRNDEIPNPLLAAATALVSGTEPENIKQAIELTDLLIHLSFVEPSVAMPGSATDADLTTDDIAEDDKAFVAAWIKRDVEAMSTFREQRAGASSGGDGAAVRDAA